jgi:DNA-binding IclR family transcriptional regulator
MLDKLTPSEERILKYMQEHKTPVTIKKMCKHFLMSESSAGRSLINLVHFGLAEVTVVGKSKLYRAKRPG